MQIVREWSADGKAERDKCFSPIIEELKSRFPEDSRSDVRVLVPGCGLARLPFDIALEGFQVRNVEPSFSTWMGDYYIWGGTVGAVGV